MKFKDVAALAENDNYDKLIKRQKSLYRQEDDMRGPFARDYTRLLHSRAYRRLKHKTQVFYNINNDHICTRMEHVAHVESVSYTIARHLGLNDELTRAIAIGHDVGHAPFGHQGEEVLDALCKEYLNTTFWHERNGLRFVDKIELLENPYKKRHNLDLTYAVRDGIVSHCGEVDENHLYPRKEWIDLEDYHQKGAYMPITWEGCVVKVSDKIAYLGRDIEDAITLGFVDEKAKETLLNMARANDKDVLNTTVIINNMVTDLCKHSSPEQGICFSQTFLDQMNELKGFNYQYIYKNPRFNPYIKYSKLVMYEIFDCLYQTFRDGVDWKLLASRERYYPVLMSSFQSWLMSYAKEEFLPKEKREQIQNEYENEKIYANLNEKEIYIQAIIDYIAGMTDRFAIQLFQEMLDFK